MLTPGKYFVGAAVRLTASFAAADGSPSDPETVVVKINSPCGDTKTFTFGTDDNVTQQSTGNYAAIVTPNHSGRWFARWVGTDSEGNVIAMEESFNVQRSRFEDCCVPCRDYR